MRLFTIISTVLVALLFMACSNGNKTPGKSGDEVTVGWTTDTGPTATVDGSTPVDDFGNPVEPDGESAPDSSHPDDDSAAASDVDEDPDAAAATDESAPGPCVDKDNDGYGDNCYLGIDCDDFNPMFNVYCPPCETQTQEGCPCTQEALVEICFEGDPGSVGVGICQLGQRQCTGGHWTSCIGQVIPQPEVCDDLDNDCDGSVDEGVLSACGDCDPFCDTLQIGPDGSEEFDPTPENSEKIGKNIDGYLTLDSQQIDLAFMWVANSSENTVSRLDTEECKETGRYAVCANPSRTSVDLWGNVWVACRSDGGVVKIAIDEALCIDKHPPEGIQTAKDLNGDGKVNGNEVMQKGQDECVLFTVYPGGSCQRGLGVDAENHAWAGEWSSKKLRRLHPDDGHVVQEIGISANPYGLVIDQNGTIWVSGRGGNVLVEVDPAVGQVGAYTSNVGCFQPYGIGLDYKGRVWIGNCCCDHAAVRYDPGTKTWAKAPVHARPRGLAGSQDGNVYVANDQSSEVAIVDSDTLQTLGYMTAGGGRFPIGMAIDFSGYVWAANQSAASASKFDPITKQMICEIPVGNGPYTYSDMTGYALHNFTAPQGHYAHVFGGWEGFRVKWTAVYVDADYQDPENCFIKVRVRTGQDPEDLAAKPWQGYYGPYPPENFPLDLLTVPDMDGPLLEVEVTLHSQSSECTPMVKSIEAKFASD